MNRRAKLEIGEYVLRLAFFAFVPFGVVLLAMLVPMGAAIANMVLALGAFFFGEVLIEKADKKPWMRRVLRRQLAFEAYYREHPPRPFLYYVFSPILLPYWLVVRSARRELWLFKGYTVVTAVVISVQGVYRYFFVYQPQLDFTKFIAAFGISIVVETLAVMMLIMPMTTSVVALHRKKQHWRLVYLLAVGFISAGMAATYMWTRHRTFPSLETRSRIVARSTVDPATSRVVLRRALERAWAVRKTEGRDVWERETDGTITGAPLEQARESLIGFYRPDEAEAFELWTTARKDRPGIMVVFAEGRKKRSPVWLAMKYDGTVIERLPEIPRAARVAMRSAGAL
ncbi:MAG: hypothetical protein KIT84_21100 [Labilithrix sp.]|nr:hypothetical protein [Labilithrix sp.]MCW5813540.1 hypothetical protein [Labilithrix sp.]